jgi:hypothetical protein
MGAMASRSHFEPDAPQREAALFYGLFLRGYPVEDLRQDIDIPRALLQKWMKSPVFEGRFRETLRGLYRYRKQVLAIFEQLVSNEQNRQRLQ